MEYIVLAIIGVITVKGYINLYKLKKCEKENSKRKLKNPERINFK